MIQSASGEHWGTATVIKNGIKRNSGIGATEQARGVDGNGR